MLLDLRCVACGELFSMSASSPAFESRLDQMMADGPWGLLGDGVTVEDQVYSALELEPTCSCPECGGRAEVCEASLGLLSSELLACW